MPYLSLHARGESLFLTWNSGAELLPTWEGLGPQNTLLNSLIQAKWVKTLVTLSCCIRG